MKKGDKVTIVVYTPWATTEEIGVVEKISQKNNEIYIKNLDYPFNKTTGQKEEVFCGAKVYIKEIAEKYKNKEYMEIYTADLVDIAKSYGEKINKMIKEGGDFVDYVAEDECCNLQHDIRKKLYERLSVAFYTLVNQEAVADVEHAYYIQHEFKDKLFKIINEL